MVGKCGSNNMEKIPEQDLNKDFDPNAPYSSSMDNVPLKVLFGVSNVKVRQSPPHEKKVVQISLSSPKDQVDSNEALRRKLRDSLASALAMVSVKQQIKDSKFENSLQMEPAVPETHLIMNSEAVAKEEIEFKAESVRGNDTESPKTLKREREEFDQKQELAEAPKSLSCLGSNEGHNELNMSANCTDMAENGPSKRIKLEKEEINRGVSVQTRQITLETEEINREVNEQTALINLEKEEVNEQTALIHLENEDINKEVNEQTAQIKSEKEDISREINEQMIETSDFAQIVAVKIEAELFRKYAGVNKKYKEKARSLLFNLKDRNNPELRARVVSGEIAPERLCCMTAEQLASKELSQWRIAKAEELAHMIVLPDSDVNYRRLVKKTHKGEYQVEVVNNDVGPEVATGGSPLQIKQENLETDVPNIDEITLTARVHDNNIITSPVSTTLRTISGQVFGVSNSEIGSTEFVTLETTGEQKVLPEIMSLDDYMGTKADKSEEAAEDVTYQNGESTDWATESGIVHKEDSMEWKKTLPDDLIFEEEKYQEMVSSVVVHSEHDKLHYATGDQEWNIKNADCSLSSEKHWEGMLQLTPLVVETLIAIFKSGEKTSTTEWSKFVEVKGRVKLDAFEKFLQELPLSRSRAVMVVTFRCKDASSESSLTNVQEVADSYKQDARVGFAEPAPGVELYLCPPDIVTMKMLNKFISYEDFENISEQECLIGCVVWRRNNGTLPNVIHKLPEKQYINAKKLALSGHLLDSPTHPGVSESMPYGADSTKYDISTSYDKYSVQNRSPRMLSASKTILHVENTTAEAVVSSEINSTIGFSSFPAQLETYDPQTNDLKDQVSILDDLNDDDVPPGFGPHVAAIRNNAYAETHVQSVDDDDLPDFDYNSMPVSYQPSLGQQPSQNCVLAVPTVTCPNQPPLQQPSTICNQGYFQSNESLHSPPRHAISHQNVQHAPRPPSTPHPTNQLRELIQKYGQSDAPYSSGPNCAPDVGEIDISSQIMHRPISIPQHTPVNAIQMPQEQRWKGDDNIPEWRPFFPPRNSSFVQPMRPMLPSHMGPPNFRGNYQGIHPLALRDPPPQRGPPQMRPPLGATLQMLPNLPQGPAPPFPPGLRPLTGMVRPMHMVMSERDQGHFIAKNPESLHASYNFRPAISGPDIRHIDGRNRMM